jgi:polysaccharide deacetylase 2 family uncharacterized protein YibQ
MKAISGLLLLALAAPAAASSTSTSTARGKLAIVIDDFGFDYPTTPDDAEWWALPFPFTAAVMPESRYTKRAAEGAKKSGHPILLHFPFDPFLPLKLPKDAVLPADAEKVSALLEKGLKQVPDAVGVNNHRSYKGTMNQPMMAWFMPKVKEKGLFFLDSRVSGKTVAYAEAKKAGVKTAINDFFLEEPKTGEEFCRKWLKTGAALAKRRGTAIIIGHHYYRTTLECLKKGAPELAKQGVDLVPVSELVK